jgi:mitochondrial fission protein ELM1
MYTMLLRSLGLLLASYFAYRMLSTLVKRMATQSTLTRPLLAELHNFWLQDVPKRYDQAIPAEAFKRWFTANPDLDATCM